MALQLETLIQIYIVQAIELNRKAIERKWPIFRYNHTPNPGKLGKAKGALFKRMGYHKGWPDLTFIWGVNSPLHECNYNIGFMEIKTPAGVMTKTGKLSKKGKMSDEQKDFQRDASILKPGMYSIVHSTDEALKALKDWGVL